MLLWVVLSCALLPLAGAQLDAFALPNPNRYAPKPTVPPELRSFFELDGHARELIDTLMGPRPGGFFPEKTYEVGASQSGPAGPVHQISGLERTLEQFFTAPEEPAGGQSLPPGFNSGFALSNNNKALAGFQQDTKAKKVTKDEEVVEGSGAEPKSSIGGIPNVFPKLPKAPVRDNSNVLRRTEPVIVQDAPKMPEMNTRPEVPEGGFAPSSDIRRAPQSVSDVAQSIDEPTEKINSDEYGGLAAETSTGSGGLIGTIINLIGLGAKKQQEPADKNALGKAVSSLIGGENSPLPAKNVISNVLYKALTSGSVNETLTDDNGSPKNLSLTPAQTAAIGENLEMIQNLIIQPSSPLCQNKPQPVAFDMYSMMGQWYQVLYSPPLSSGPCSMVAYKKLSDVNSGSVGSIFEIFEYTTDATPYAKPKISSGYAIIKSPGELIYRTTSNQEDVNVHVIHTGPLNENKEYEYVVMSTNCNYPIYVFARDPVVYKQRYEEEVSTLMEKKGLINGFSRLLNIVSPVDNTMCTFPPSLFNIQG